MLKRLSLCLLAACVLGGKAFAETPAEADLESSVPELSALHEVIVPIWHTAYPAKDIAALKGFVPRINELAGKIYGARLPGILRERKPAWKAGVSDLKKAVKAYNKAAKGSDDQALLDAAEELHRRYELLFRAIRPVLPEIEAFHKTLYIVYHKDLPASDWESIRKLTPELNFGAKAISAAVLPKRFEALAPEFRKAAEALLKAATALQDLGSGANGAAVKAAVENIHSEYLLLQKIFE